MKRRILMLVFGCAMVMATFSAALTPLSADQPAVGNGVMMPKPTCDPNCGPR